MRYTSRTALAVAACAAITCATAPAAAADNAVLGSTCYHGWYSFTVTATGGDIPAGSQWTSGWSAATQFPEQYGIVSDPPLFTYTRLAVAKVSVTNPNPIPAGTRVVIEPRGYPLTNKSLLRLYLQGYGGSVGRAFDDWPTC
ncbi:hypothetical protein [Actinokineospora sp. NBRC 105648]|uniref:hypothetical protein n=1 Tax=Actinokineospora sp. NBRC 105648 TaxID=3032206 RepID=UPI0024A14588|nr:hypothetical protein [Actinokineospora sp. NBRC 105648]GLZ39512.1 hypothetical protein Acsp05_31360 [Actinokineospora sp. NBRC 105648]